MKTLSNDLGVLLDYERRGQEEKFEYKRDKYRREMKYLLSKGWKPDNFSLWVTYFVKIGVRNIVFERGSNFAKTLRAQQYLTDLINHYVDEKQMCLLLSRSREENTFVKQSLPKSPYLRNLYVHLAHEHQIQKLRGLQGFKVFSIGLNYPEHYCKEVLLKNCFEYEFTLGISFG